MNLFDAKFVIDGTEQSSTLRELVEACNGPFDSPVKYFCNVPDTLTQTVIDETIDFCTVPLKYDAGLCREYAKEIISGKCHGQRGIRAGAEARMSIGEGLVGNLFRSPAGERLEDIAIELHWEWDCLAIGSLALLYRSVAAAADYAYELGIKISGCSIKHHPGMHELTATTGNPPHHKDVYISDKADCTDKIDGATIICIPFDPSDPHLAGTALAALLGVWGEEMPGLLDPDYFIDSYEVVKEMIDDGIVIAATAISDGGPVCALERLAGAIGKGMDIDITYMQEAYLCNDPVMTLFNEIPGVIIAVSDEDYGYIDSQMLLQEIAYYPVGTISEHKTIRIRHKESYNIADVLMSIINNPQS